MNEQKMRLRNAGFVTFFFSGICAISSGVVVSLLQEQYGFAYGMTGTLLSLMSIGNLLAGFLTGVLPGVLGLKPSVLLLTIGYTLGYGIMGFTGAEVLLAAAFFLVGIAKGSAMNACTILVSDNSADRTRGMNLMHSCYACGALLCPFLIAAAAKVSTSLAVFLLAALGVVLWLVYLKTPMGGKVQSAKAAIDWSFLRSYQFWLLTGLLFCRRPLLVTAMPKRPVPPQTGLTGQFLRAVEGAVSAMARVCGFVVFFLVLLRLAEGLIGPLPPLAAGVLELTNGILRLTPDRRGFVTAAALLGWGGLSVHCQTAAVTAGSGISLRLYVPAKAVQAALSAGLAALLAPYLLP